MLKLHTRQQCCWWITTYLSEPTQSSRYKLTQKPTRYQDVALIPHQYHWQIIACDGQLQTHLKCWFAWKLTGQVLVISL